MTAIRISFALVALVFLVLAGQQAWHAFDALRTAGQGWLVSALAAVACLVAAAGTVRVTLRLE